MKLYKDEFTLEEYTQALLNINPDAMFIIEDEELTWDESICPCPNRNDIVVQAEIVRETKLANEYKRLRQIEYSKINQDELRFDDLMNGTTTWQDTILEIKEKYPKPS
jgi:hypothetical protein